MFVEIVLAPAITTGFAIFELEAGILALFAQIAPRVLERKRLISVIKRRCA